MIAADSDDGDKNAPPSNYMNGSGEGSKGVDAEDSDAMDLDDDDVDPYATNVGSGQTML